MESIQASLKKWLNNNEDFMNRYNKMRENILNNEDIKMFMKAHPDIDQVAIDKGLSKLHEYTKQSINCNQCDSLQTCCNVVQGYTPTLKWENEEIHLVYNKCKTKLQDETRQEKQKLVQSLYMPQEILAATVEKIEYDHNRKKAFLKRINSLMKRNSVYQAGGYTLQDLLVLVRHSF